LIVGDPCFGDLGRRRRGDERIGRFIWHGCHCLW
jgi:hypothetical protein